MSLPRKKLPSTETIAAGINNMFSFVLVRWLPVPFVTRVSKRINSPIAKHGRLFSFQVLVTVYMKLK